MYRCTPSPAASVFEQNAQTIRWSRRRRRDLQVAEATGGSSNLDRVRRVRDNPSDRRVSVEDGQRSAPPHRLEMLAQPRLEVRNAHTLHDYILVTTGHECPASGVS